MMVRFFRLLTLIAVCLLTTRPVQARFWPSKDAWRGRQLLLRQRWGEAAAAFQRAAKRGEISPAEREGLAYALLKAGEFPQAVEEYKHLCGKYPRTPSFWVNLGLAYAYQGRPELMAEAEKAFRQALALNPRHADALLNLAVLLHRLGRPAEALTRYQEAAAAARGKGYVWIGLADGLRDQGDLEGARWLYQSALRHRDEWPGVLLGMARLLLVEARLHPGERGKQEYRDAVTYATEFLRRTGDTQARRRRWQRDITEARHLIEVTEARLNGGSPTGSVSGPPQIRLLWPPQGQLQGQVAALRVDRDQLGVIGAIMADQADAGVTVNGVYPDYLPVSEEDAPELRALFQGKEAAAGGLSLNKVAGLLSKAAGLLSKAAGLLSKGDEAALRTDRDASSGIYLFYTGVTLAGPETPVRIVARDAAHPPVELTFTVRRPASTSRTRWPALPDAGKTWALFVGVDQYEIPGVPSLLYAASDARRLFSMFSDPDRGGDPASRHAFLLASGSDEPPTKANIEDRVEEIARGAQPGDTVVLFFSGHGCTAGGSTYLLTSDANVGPVSEGPLSPEALRLLKDSALDRAELGRLVKRLSQKSRRVVVFLDACRAGGILEQTSGMRSLASAGSSDPQALLADDLAGAYLLVSCGKSEYSYEDTTGLQAGVFAHFLEQGLAGAGDENGDGVVGLSELTAYVRKAVHGWCFPPEAGDTPSVRGTQTPQPFPASGWPDDPLVVTPVGAAREALARLKGRLEPAEYEEAEAGLLAPADRSILAEWLLELEASLQPPAESRPPAAGAMSPAITLADYRRYRASLREPPESLPHQVYRLLRPRQAIIAVRHLPPSDAASATPEQREWRDQVARLVRKELPLDRFLDWMDEQVRTESGGKSEQTTAPQGPSR